MGNLHFDAGQKKIGPCSLLYSSHLNLLKRIIFGEEVSVFFANRRVLLKNEAGSDIVAAAL